MPGSAGDLDVCPDCKPAFGSGERLHRVGSVSECVDCGYRFTGVRETAPPERSEERSVGRPSVVEHVAVAVLLAIRLGGGNRLPLFAPLFVVGYETIVDGILL